MRHLLLFTILFTTLSCKKTVPPPVEPAYQQPDTEDLIIYELFLRSFSEEGTLNAVTERLDELDNLGINCIWLMPFQPMGQVKKINPLGSPYSIRNYRGVDPSYGTHEDLKKLIAEAHDRGIGIMLDFVANHTAWDHPWITNHPELYTKDHNGDIIHPPGTNWMDVADLNFGVSATWDSVIANMKWWVDNFEIDGFRCDYAEGVPATFWEEALTKLEQDRDLIMLAEGETRNLLEAGFDIAFSWSMHNRMVDAFDGSRDASWPGFLATSERNLDPDSTYRLYFITNHDFVSFEDLPIQDFNSYEGIRSAALAMTYMPGVPMLYNGQEVGSMQRLNLFNAVPINWQDPAGMRPFFQELYTLYHQLPELRNGTYQYHNQHAEVITFERVGQKRSLVVSNIRNTTVTMELPPVYRDITLEEQFSGDIYIGDSLTLEPYQYLLLRDK